MSISTQNPYSHLLTQSSIQKFLKKNPTPENTETSISLKFWQRIMNECVRRKYLSNKNQEFENCSPMNEHYKIKPKNIYSNFNESAKCHKQYREEMEKYMAEMQFFMKKFDKCVQEGLGARYNIDNVQQVCGNKIIKFIRANGDIL